MNKSILKVIAGGAIFGLILFFAWPVLLIILLLKFIFTPFGMGRMMMAGRYSRMGFRGRSVAWAEKIRNMSEEEYAHLKSKMNEGNPYSCGNQFETNS